MKINNLLTIVLISVSLLITSCGTEVKEPKESTPTLIETLNERRERIEKEIEEMLQSQININPSYFRSLC
jgi:chaperonin cofactor prefoldin